MPANKTLSDRRVSAWIGGFFLLAAAAYSQPGRGELRLEVRDAAGLPLAASGELTSQANQFRQGFAADTAGRYIARGLPFGPYQLRLEQTGFATYSVLVEIRSEVPLVFRAVMNVAPLETALRVSAAETLLDPHAAGPHYAIGAARIAERPDVIDLVRSQPGWLLEANGVLHPRGAEYNTQYVVDGIPVLDNRSPAFAPPIEAEDLESIRLLTGAYPAEYGRRLGGVIEVARSRDFVPGLHLRSVLEGASFDSQDAFLSGQYARGALATSLAVQASRTGRFLDPPVEENFTNRMSGGGGFWRLEADLTARDRLRGYFQAQRTGFQVPNERVQQRAGQRQDRRNRETMAHLAYDRTLSAATLASVRVMARDLSASLWSNPLSTPIVAFQDRGFREVYAGGAVAFDRASHEVKVGGDFLGTALREQFSSVPDFHFSARRRGHSAALFAQDRWRAGRWTLSAGLRWDRYHLLVAEHAWSPRLGASYHWPDAGLVLRASYDRAFEIPPMENLLLASSGQTPVPPSFGHYLQGGFAKSLWGRLRLDGTYFRRRIRNFSDDDLLLNTGVSFPIAFDSADIHGIEARLELPDWRGLSGFAAWSNLAGTARLPVTGGLFVDHDAPPAGSFPITQDQRNTASAEIRYQFTRRVWASTAASYGSGLPVELDDDDVEEQRYSPRILERVDFERGRVRPQFSLDASAGIEVWTRESASVRLQAEGRNLTGRLNLINFAGLFSGTALAPPRSWALRLTVTR